MMDCKRLLLIMAIACWASLGSAAEESKWAGKGSLGFVSQRGNSETETLTVAAKLVRNMERWRHTVGAGILNSSEDGTDTAERFDLSAQSDYKLGEKLYWYGSIRYEQDEFSQFDSQATLASGYGRQLLDRLSHKLNGEVGIGYRTAQMRATGESENNVVLRGVLGYRWILSANATLSNDLLFESGADNTFAKNITALSADIVGNLAVKLAHELRHNTKVDEPANNSDFVTTVSLVYSLD